MPLSDLAPIKQALVQTLRSNAALKASLTGGFHEGMALQDSPFPYLTYQIFGANTYTWGSMMVDATADITVWAENSVEADNLDALVLQTLHDAALNVAGQNTLICRRVLTRSVPETNEEGKKTYSVLSSWEVWTDQPIPLTTSARISADAVIT